MDDARLWLLLVLQVGVVVGLAVLAYKLRARFRFQDQQFQHLNAAIEKKVLPAVSETSDEILNGLSVTSLDLRFPLFLGEASIDSFHARYLIQQLVICKPKTILELGSGSSSILLAKVMQRISAGNFTHISVDHDERYLELSRRYAELNDVAGSIRFYHCPLEIVPTLGTSWYSHLSELLGNEKIDFLLVDGPPAYLPEQSLARYPALPQLYDHLDTECTIILDDANRPGEKCVIERWLKEFPEFVLSMHPRGKGVAILSRTRDQNLNAY